MGLARTLIAGIALATLALAAPAYAAPTLAPTNLQVTGITTTHMHVTWDAPTEPGVTAASAHAYQATRTPTEYKTRDSNGTLTSRDVDRLACGTAYKIYANFYDGSGRSPDGTVIATTAPCTKPAPAAPSNLKASPISGNSIQFSWDPSGDPTVPYGARTVVGPLAGTVIPSLSNPDTSFTPDRLVCGQSYLFSVWWVNDEGRPSDLASTTATTADCSTLGAPGPAPTGLHVTEAFAGGFNLAWDAPGAEVLGSRLAVTTPGINSVEWRAGNQQYGGLRFPTTCGQTYDLTLSWVYMDGGISQPQTASSPAPACPAAPPVTPAPPIDSTPPAVTVKRTRLRVDARGEFSVSLTCGVLERTCKGRLTLRAARNGKRIHLPRTCGLARFAIPGGRTTAVGIALRRKAFALVKAARSLKFTLEVAARDAAGNGRTTLVPLVLRAPRRVG